MYFIMLLVNGGTDTSATFKYLTTIEAETGKTIKKTFPTLAEAQEYVKNEMVASGLYSLNSFIVCKSITVTADITLTEEVSEGSGD